MLNTELNNDIRQSLRTEGELAGLAKNNDESLLSLVTAENSVLFITEQLKLGQVLFEKCDLKSARRAYSLAFELSKKFKRSVYMIESLLGLLRLAGDAEEDTEISHWNRILDQLLDEEQSYRAKTLYCKSVLSRYSKNFDVSIRFSLRSLRAYRKLMLENSELWSVTDFAKVWVNLVYALIQKGHVQRAQLLTDALMTRFSGKNLQSIDGSLFLIKGFFLEKESKYSEALHWYNQAHAAFLFEKNWYHYIWVLYAYARVARLQRQYDLAAWYLDLMEKAARDSEFAVLRTDIAQERKLLDHDSVDLLIDSRSCLVRTRESDKISLKKQYVLLSILEELSQAHSSGVREGALSKAEIIERVWGEKYRPDAHDNKLYYNINRLRKLIETDMKQPKYLQNWKEGYRLSPKLKVHWIGGEANAIRSTETH